MRHLRPLLIATAIAAAFSTNGMAADSAASAPAAKVVVTSANDLPRFSYPLTGTATQFVETDDATFMAFTKTVRADVDKVFAGYDVKDPSTLKEMLSARLDTQELSGDWDGALKTIDELRAQETKPAQKLLSGLFGKARVEAAKETGATSGPAFDKAFRTRYAAMIDPLPWDVVQDGVKSAFASARLLSRAAIVANVTTELDPAAAKSHALDAGEAWDLINLRVALKRALPVSQARADVLGAYIKSHDKPKPDIWAAREVTLTAADHLTPVNVGIWDSGVDVALFPKQLYTDKHPTASGSHGLAFDDDGKPSKSWLYPLTPAQRAAYPAFQSLVQGRVDLQNGVDSADARATLKKFATMSPAEMHDMFEFNKVLGFYTHGTHCAGIAVKGNPAARLVVARFDDQLPDLPFAPTEDWVKRMGADFKQMGEYFQSRHVRVVNLSWGDFPVEFETWLSKTGGGKDPEARKAEGAKLFALWKQAIAEAIAAAPDTLFIAAAGNSDSNVGFVEDVPASLKAPNLIAVGAVNQAGDETSFTSHGDTVVAHANGYLVDSVVPGGRHLPYNGTSMAAPGVVNLAAKLFALDPKLTPAQVVDLIRRGATTTEDGRRHLIDQKKSVELLKAQKVASAH